MTDQRKRTVLAVGLAVASVIAFLIIWDCRGQIFYPQALDTPDDLWRFSWMVPFILLGLAVRAYRLRVEPGSPWVAYSKDFAYLLLVSFIFFAMCHSVLSLKSWLYYLISALAALAFTFPNGLPQRLESYVNKFFGIEEDRDSESRIQSVFRTYKAAISIGKSGSWNRLIEAGVATLRDDSEVRELLERVAKFSIWDPRPRLAGIDAHRFFVLAKERRINFATGNEVNKLVEELRGA